MGRIFCQEPCSYPRETILLLKQKGNLQSSSNPAHWPAYKTTTSHDRIRLERAEDLEALKQADCQFNREKEILRCQASDRKSTRLNSSHVASSYAVFCL